MRNYSGQLPNETSENYLKKFKASVNCPKSEWHMNKPLFKNIYKHLIKKKKIRVCCILLYFQHSDMEIPFETGVAKNSGLSLPPASGGRAFFSGGVRIFPIVSSF